MRNVFRKNGRTASGLKAGWRSSVAPAAIGVLLTALAVTGCSQADTKPTASAGKEQMASSAAGGPTVMRRLTEAQYEQIIADLFGHDIVAGGPFEPDQRDGGLFAVGAGEVSIAGSGLSQYDKMASSIAAQVLDEKNRAVLLGCTPANAKQPDDACAKAFLSRVGRYLYRRPLTDQELQTRVAIAAASAKTRGSFYDGLQTSLATLLVSPNFLFVQETTEADPAHPGEQRLTAYSKASRLSFFLWNNAPDDELLAAAEKGELNSQKGLTHQVDRMLASQRVEDGVRAFFTDMLEFDKYETLSKDALLYPKFNFKVGEDEQEQTLRTIVDQLVTKDGDYRDLFTTRHTFLNRELAAIYEVPMVAVTAGWQPFDFAPETQQAGILTHASFVSLHSHPGRSSPTLRGKALREVLLCQKVPDPPGNVNFALVQDTKNPNYKTVRQRLTAHATEAMCTGCHKIMDPVGLALENFDTVGGHRAAENGVKIDASGELDGIKFTDAVGLGLAVHDNPATASCLVKRVYSYGVGRNPTKSETDWLTTSLNKSFAADGYKVPQLLRRIATSDTFFRITPPETNGKAPAVASAQ